MTTLEKPLEELIKKKPNKLKHAGKIFTALAIMAFILFLCSLLIIPFIENIVFNGVTLGIIFIVTTFILIFLFASLSFVFNVNGDDHTIGLKKGIERKAAAILKEMPFTQISIESVKVVNDDGKLYYSIYHNNIAMDMPLNVEASKCKIKIKTSQEERDKTEIFYYKQTDKPIPVVDTGFIIPANFMWLDDCILELRYLPEGYKAS